MLITGVTDENGAGVARGPDGYLPEQSPPPVPGYLVQYVTAENNGLYGIYAFNRTDGVIRDNLASGGSDSGIYVGQCEQCGALVQSNVITFNAAGVELANASGVVITGNRIVHNRIGISVLSNYLEAHGPTRGVEIVGNLIADNDEPQTPAQAGGAFGVGLGLGGTVDAEVRANTISGNDAVGVWITSSEDFAPTGNHVVDNVWGENGVDVAMAASELVPGSGTASSRRAPSPPLRRPHGLRTHERAVRADAGAEGADLLPGADPAATPGSRRRRRGARARSPPSSRCRRSRGSLHRPLIFWEMPDERSASLLWRHTGCLSRGEHRRLRTRPVGLR